MKALLRDPKMIRRIAYLAVSLLGVILVAVGGFTNDQADVWITQAMGVIDDILVPLISSALLALAAAKVRDAPPKAPEDPGVPAIVSEGAYPPEQVEGGM